MNDAAIDVQAVKSYGSEKVGRIFIGIGGLAIAVGVFIATFNLGSSKMLTLGWVLAGMGVLLAGYALVIQPSFPGKPLLELSPRGIALRTVGDIFIPWDEVRGVEWIDRSTRPGVYAAALNAPVRVTFKNVTLVLVSRAFYDRDIIPNGLPIPSSAWNNTFIPKGAVVQVAMHHDVLAVTPEALRKEVAARWYAVRGDGRPGGPAPAAGDNAAESNEPGAVPDTATRTDAAPRRPVRFRINWDK